MVTISSCPDKKSLQMFERIPEKIHYQNPNFIPPFPGSVRKLFSPKSAFLKHGELFPFIAFRDAEPVGRICAVINRAHNDYHKDKVAFFGFFDCIDDIKVAGALYEKARETLSNRGFDVIRGPYNPSQNDECGLLVDGFDSPPMVMMTFNPAYYLDLYDKLGLVKARDLYAFYMSSELESPERMAKIVARVRKSSGFTIRSIDMKNLKEELKIFHKLYNLTLDRNWGFVPIEYEDLVFGADDLKAIADPNMVLIAEKNGEPVGFSVTVPNVNELMAMTRKHKSSAMRAIKFLWLLKTHQPKEARLFILGVHPEHRNTGIAALFYHETLTRAKNKYIGGEMSWVEESNHEITKGITFMGGKKYKTYRIYEQSLAH